MATAKKTVAKKAPAKKAVSKTVKSTDPADLKKPAGTPAEGLLAKPVRAERKSRSFDDVVKRSASGALGSGRSRDQKIRLEGHDPRGVAVAVAKLRAEQNK